jgi:hypothetical protein
MQHLESLCLSVHWVSAPLLHSVSLTAHLKLTDYRILRIGHVRAISSGRPNRWEWMETGRSLHLFGPVREC